MRICHAVAKAGGRACLRPSTHGPTKVTQSAELKDAEFGKVAGSEPSSTSAAPPAAPTPAVPTKGSRSERGTRSARQPTPPLTSKNSSDHHPAVTAAAAAIPPIAVPCSPVHMDPTLEAAFGSCPPLLCLAIPDCKGLMVTLQQKLEVR